MKKIVPDWPAPKNIKAFASTREGGFSLGPYQGLNLGDHVGDTRLTVEKNRNWLTEQSSMPETPIWLNQTHSTQVLDVCSPTNHALDADGSFTSAVGIVCSAMTADCLPVLLCNTSGTQVAAVHAGWRGLAGGIIENAVAKFHGEVMAWLGPAISQAAFEVGEDVVSTFIKQDPEAESAFVKGKNKGKWQADMFALARLRLQKAGVPNVYSSDLCTFQNREQFYSYRRDGVTGRQASFIWIESHPS